MATPDPAWLLRAWESAAAVAPAARGAVLVREAGLVEDLDDALDLPVDTLATLAARVHTEQFGPAADGLLDCDSCGEPLEISVPLELVAASGGAGAGLASERREDPDGGGTRVVALHGGRMVRVRVPTTRDLLAVRDRDDVTAALLARCVTVVGDRSEHPPAPTLDVEDLALVDAAVEELAGAAAVVVHARCPRCGTPLAAPVDVALFLWSRVEREAPGALADVADLAASFGWSESDILALSATRRCAYLALVRGAEA